MAPTKRGHKDHLIDDPDTDTDDDDYPPKKPTAIPEDWKSRCFADHHWCKHFLLSLYVNNMLDEIPGLSFVPPTMSPSQKEAIKEECKGNEKCIWKKTKKWDDKNVMPKLLQEALAGGGGGGSSNGGHTTNKGRSGSQSNLALIVTVAVASGVISFLLLLLLIYCCCCSGKRNKSPKSNVRINNVTLHSSKKSKKRPKSSTKKRLSFKSKSAKKSSRKSQKSSKKKPQFEIQVQ